MTREQFFSGDFVTQVHALLAKGCFPGIEPDGIRQAAALIKSRLLSGPTGRGVP